MPNIPPTAEEAHESPNALIRFMEQAKGNSNKWNALCDELKQAKNNAGYPMFWFPTMILGGHMNRILGEGADTPQISFE